MIRIMIWAQLPYLIQRSAAVAPYQALQTDAKREAVLLLTAHVGVCAVVAAVPILVVAMTAWGVGSLGWWLLS
jgi:hypothetical protein